MIRVEMIESRLCRDRKADASVTIALPSPGKPEAGERLFSRR